MPRIRLRNFWLNVLSRAFVVCAIMAIGLTLILPIGISFDPRAHGAMPWSATVLRTFGEIGPGLLIHWCPIGMLMSFGLTAVYEINRKLGPGVVFNLLTGRYYTPREEERIFMFLDLKNSTPLGEKMGNLKFSRLVQDFFRDTTAPLLATKGEVSHYIGDEVVLTWRPKNGLEKNHCIQFFFLMMEEVEMRAAHYEEAYGVVPEFKAGIHIGPVVAAEVGDIKSEIVYHGDVLNTTSRIIGKCSELGHDLLVSGTLFARLNTPQDLYAINLGSHLLKGKEHEVEIVALSNSPFPGSQIPDDLAPELGVLQRT